MAKKYAEIFKQNGKWMAEIYDSEVPEEAESVITSSEFDDYEEARQWIKNNR